MTGSAFSTNVYLEKLSLLSDDGLLSMDLDSYEEEFMEDR